MFTIFDFSGLFENSEIISQRIGNSVKMQIVGYIFDWDTSYRSQTPRKAAWTWLGEDVILRLSNLVSYSQNFITGKL